MKCTKSANAVQKPAKVKTGIKIYGFFYKAGIAALVIMAAVPVFIFAAFFITILTPSRITPDGFVYSKCKDRTLCIEGYKGVDTHVIVPENIDGVEVSGIGDKAFEKNDSIKSVVIPENVVSVGREAFSYCDNLEIVTLPDSVTYIGSRAFYGCSGLKNINIPESVTSIGDKAFHGCSSLKKINIPKSVTRIGLGAFEGCFNLTVYAPYPMDYYYYMDYSYYSLGISKSQWIVQ